MRHVTETYDVVVCGGGLAGVCAAIASARGGARTCLVQDRPVLGGNSSSEVRVTPHGAAAFHAYARETGILSELLIEERAQNHEEIFENGWTNSVWDIVQYDLVQKTDKLSLHLNTSVLGVAVKGRRITSIQCRVANAEIALSLEANIFIDCTGDGIVASEAGCEWRMGSEGRAEFNEPHAPPTANSDVMGNSIHFKTKNMGRPAPFKLPDWAVHHQDGRFFYDQGRHPKEIRGGYWWIEIGVPYDTIHDAENIRHELTRHALGVWDWIKNKDPKTMKLAENYALDWIGQVPGKRESRRVMGLYLMTEWDALRCTVHKDEIAFGGWFIDLHTAGGLLASTSEPASAEGYSETSEYAARSYAGPYGIPLRILISKDIDNLMMAGRNVSATHCALATVRVMATTALMGQAAGTTAAVAIADGCSPGCIATSQPGNVQQQLLRDGCFLPNVRNQDARDKALAATIKASTEARFSGLTPETKGAHEGLSYWRDQAVPLREELLHRRGQWVAVGGEPIRAARFCLSNRTTETKSVGVRLLKVDHIWDYRIADEMELAGGELVVPPGVQQWIEWPLPACSLPTEGYVRFDLLEASEVTWHVAGAIEPGHVSAFQMAPGRMRRYSSGVTMALQVEPPQQCFQAASVISGVTRPHATTNLWRSDPSQPLPQWIQLSWQEPQEIREIIVVFAGHLLREYHAYAPFYRDPQCVSHYEIQISEDAVSWKAVVSVSDNYQRHKRHQLEESLYARFLRVVVIKTNGDPSAAIYEVRIY